jgi:ribosomal protein L28
MGSDLVPLGGYEVSPSQNGTKPKWHGLVPLGGYEVSPSQNGTKPKWHQAKMAWFSSPWWL